MNRVLKIQLCYTYNGDEKGMMLLILQAPIVKS